VGRLCWLYFLIGACSFYYFFIHDGALASFCINDGATLDPFCDQLWCLHLQQGNWFPHPLCSDWRDIETACSGDVIPINVQMA